MPEIIVLSGKDLEQLLTLEEVIELIQNGFVTYYNGGYEAFPVVREMINQYQGIFGIKSGYVTTEDLLGFKAGGYWKNNPERGMPAHRSIVVLFDPQTGNPTSVMDGNIITTIRTSAVGALAAKYLARKDAASAAIIGCGTQGRAQLQALKWALPIKGVKCNDVSKENAQRFAEEMSTDDCPVKSCPTILEAVEGAEVVVTTTPSFNWIVQADWIGPGVHLSAMGADTKGKQEIEPALFKKARVVVDSFEQCKELGELQHSPEIWDLKGGVIELGEILAGKKPGRNDDQEITLFDATGIAFQDLFTADLALRLAKQKGLGSRALI